jgi:hypothetical protein
LSRSQSGQAMVISCKYSVSAISLPVA